MGCRTLLTLMMLDCYGICDASDPNALAAGRCMTRAPLTTAESALDRVSSARSSATSSPTAAVRGIRRDLGAFETAVCQRGRARQTKSSYWVPFSCFHGS